MKPIEFKEQNRVLTKPESMTDEQCRSLPVHADKGVCTSCWKLTFKERLNAILFGKIWVSVLTGTTTQPPVSIQCKKNNFRGGKIIEVDVLLTPSPESIEGVFANRYFRQYLCDKIERIKNHKNN